jgi:hypothetical protein
MLIKYMSDLRGQHKSFGVHKQASVHGWSSDGGRGVGSIRLIVVRQAACSIRLLYNQVGLELSLDEVGSGRTV